MRPVSGLLSICIGEYGGHRQDEAGGMQVMSLKSRVIRLQRKMDEIRGKLYLDDLLSPIWNLSDELKERFIRLLPHDRPIPIGDLIRALPDGFREEVIRLLLEKYGNESKSKN